MVRREYKNNPMINGSDDGFQEALRIFLEGRNRRPGGSPLHQTLRHILFWLKNIYFFYTIDLYDKLSFAESSWIPTSPCFNSQVSSWFCRTNHHLICPYPLLNIVVFENLWRDSRSNRKWNLQSAVNWKWQPETLFLIGHWRLERMRNDLSNSSRPYRLSISHNQ